MTFHGRLCPESEEKTSLDAFWNDAKSKDTFAAGQPRGEMLNPCSSGPAGPLAGLSLYFSMLSVGRAEYEAKMTFALEDVGDPSRRILICDSEELLWR